MDDMQKTPLEDGAVIFSEGFHSMFRVLVLHKGEALPFAITLLDGNVDLVGSQQVLVTDTGPKIEYECLLSEIRKSSTKILSQGNFKCRASVVPIKDIHHNK